MNIQLWFTREMNLWRWTLTDGSRPILKMEAGSQPNLRDALNDVANTVEYLLNTGKLDEDARESEEGSP